MVSESKMVSGAEPVESMTNSQKLGILIVLSTFLWVLFSIGKYWLADVRYAEGQKHTQFFQKTQNYQYLLSAYNNYSRAYQLNRGEPAIASEYAVSAAFLSAAIAAKDPEAATQLAQQSLSLSQISISISPRHPNYYKSRARTLILLSDFDPKFLKLAAEALAKATQISPTDPRIPYNLGIIYKYLNATPSSTFYFQESLRLKPDFADPQAQLNDIMLLKSPSE